MIGCGKKIGAFDCCTVVQGDTTVLLPQLPAAAVEAVITDPPYGVEAADWDSAVPYKLLDTFLQVSSGPVLWFGAASKLQEALSPAGFSTAPERVLIWAPSFTLSKVAAHGLAYRYHPMYAWRLDKRAEKRHDKAAVWDVLNTPTECGNLWKHSCTKPIALMEALCCWAVQPQACILDPFAGSGSTLVAAKNNGYHFLGFEKDAYYCAISEHRLYPNTQAATAFWIKAASEKAAARTTLFDDGPLFGG